MFRDRREEFYSSLLSETVLSSEHGDFASLQIALDLAFTYDIFHQILACKFLAFGLSRSTFNILMLLHHGSSDGMQLHELGELLLVSRANITGLIDHLEQKGLVTRVVDAADRRARFAKITEDGTRLVERVSLVHSETVACLMSGLSEDEKLALTTLFKKLRKSLVAGQSNAKRRAD